MDSSFTVPSPPCSAACISHNHLVNLTVPHKINPEDSQNVPPARHSSKSGRLAMDRKRLPMGVCRRGVVQVMGEAMLYPIYKSNLRPHRQNSNLRYSIPLSLWRGFISHVFLTAEELSLICFRCAVVFQVHTHGIDFS